MKQTIAILLLTGLAFAAGSKNYWHITRMNEHDVIVSCPSGQIPDVIPTRGRIETNYVVVRCSQ